MVKSRYLAAPHDVALDPKMRYAKSMRFRRQRLAFLMGDLPDLVKDKDDDEEEEEDSLQFVEGDYMFAASLPTVTHSHPEEV